VCSEQLAIMLSYQAKPVLDQPHLLTGFDKVWLGTRAQLAKTVEGFDVTGL
jgi:hypothetical protein